MHLQIALYVAATNVRMTCVKIVRLFGATNVVYAVDVILHHCVKKVVESRFVKNVNLHVSTAIEQDARNALTTESVVGVVKVTVGTALVKRIAML